MTSLPNAHPALVHFPIALSLAGVLFDVACLYWRRHTWLDHSAVSLYMMSALSGMATAVTGKLASGAFSDLAPAAERLLGEHGDWAFLSVLLLFVVAGLRFEVAWRDREARQVRWHRLRVLAFGLALVCQWVLFETAMRGGALVYRHGVGVSGETAPDAQ